MIRTLFREANKPEPTEKIDKSGYVKWGEDNLYPQFLVGIAYDNPIHGGIINQKVTFMTAGGVIIEGDEQNVQFAHGETLQSTVESVIRDFEIGETYSLIFKKSLSSGKWYAENVDFELIRATENLVFFDYSDDWSKSRQGKETNYRKIKSIHYVTPEDTECILTNVTRPKQRFHGEGKKTLTSNYYPVPTYSGAITSILAGIEQDYFTYSEVVNSYKGGTLINLANGVPETVAEEDKIIRRVKGEASKKETQGGLTITFSDGQDSAPTVQQINGNDLDKRYLESNKEITKKIMMAHSVISAELFGLVSDSLFGSKEQLEISYKLFQENYVKKRQAIVADSLTWAFKRLNSFAGKIIFNDYVLNLEKNVSTDNAVSNAINGMSPLVANKLLNVLTTNEIRALARLQPIEGGDVVPTATPTVLSQEKMSEEIDVVSMFEKCGVLKDEYTILNSRAYDSFEDNEESFKNEFILGKFAFELTDIDRQILQMIDNGESFDSISKAIGKGGVFISQRLLALGENGFVNDWEVTDKGKKASVPATELEVRYSYELRSNAPDLVAGGSSRPFCERMVSLPRLYTRDEINKISSAIGRDVWTFRGGWYHNPETDINTPSCRHQFQQHITVKKK